MADLTAGQGVIEILSKLDEQEINALAKTVTQGLLKIDCLDDAINGILKHSPNIVSILRRKVVTKEILFSYLDDNNIPVQTPASKNDLIDRILEFWNVQSSQQGQEAQINSSGTCQEVQIGTQIDSESVISTLAEQFSKWFYTMLNSSDGVGIEHFYPDSKLTLTMITSENSDDQQIENPQDICLALNSIKLQHRLFLNPNLSKEGVQGHMDPHGLVVVMVCGTLHVENTIVGVFDQVFSLARDPFCDNNWKIKNTKLLLRSKSGVIGLPRLCDSDLASNLLALK